MILRQRQEENLASSSMTMRTGRTRPTSPERVCSLSTMSEDTLRRRRGTGIRQKVEVILSSLLIEESISRSLVEFYVPKMR